MDDFHVGEMAYELAEWDFQNQPLQWLLDNFSEQWIDDDEIDVAMDKVWRNLLRNWQDMATKDPERVEKMWRDMTGETDINAHGGDSVSDYDR